METQKADLPPLPGTITAGGNLQAENGPLPPPVTFPQVIPVTHQRVPTWHWQPTYRDVRRKSWPEEVELQEKLWRSEAALKKTADFTLRTGRTVTI